MDILYKRIKKRREELKMTQEELAEIMGYKSRSSINKIELGLNDLPQSKIIEFATALKTTPSYLMGWDNDEVNTYGDHKANLDHLADKPELLEIYNDIYESENLQLLFDTARDLTPDELEAVLNVIKMIHKGE